ncbi:uncharacterized protein VTP21DRAFT_6111 [Calcarisporiella thermophila]|uniref:uncharacterized protein n=1 Tax=Calcarisporiella thermophila TaxID=911321 RepID=UPI003742B679
MPYRIGPCVRTFSLFIFVAFTALCLIVSAYDIIAQALEPGQLNVANGQNYITVLIIGGVYVLLGVISSVLGSLRLASVRRALKNIPREYIMIREEDVPKRVFNRIQQCLNKSSVTASRAYRDPEMNGQPGWGKPKSDFEGVNFRASVAKTPFLIERAATRNSPQLSRHPSMSVRHYLEHLIENGLVDSRVGLLYVEGYERARFGAEEWTEVEYTRFMKLLTLLLADMGGVEEEANGEGRSWGEEEEEGRSRGSWEHSMFPR